MASAWPGACWLGKATAAACREFEVCFRSPRDLYSSESLWARRKLTTPGDTASVELWAVGVDEVHHTLSRFSPHAPPPIDFHAVLGVNLAAAPLLTGAASSSQARYLSKHLSGGGRRNQCGHKPNSRRYRLGDPCPPQRNHRQKPLECPPARVAASALRGFVPAHPAMTDPKMGAPCPWTDNKDRLPKFLIFHPVNDAS